MLRLRTHQRGRRPTFFFPPASISKQASRSNVILLIITLHNSLSEFDTHLVLVEPDVFKVPISLGLRAEKALSRRPKGNERCAASRLTGLPTHMQAAHTGENTQQQLRSSCSRRKQSTGRGNVTRRRLQDFCCTCKEHLAHSRVT